MINRNSHFITSMESKKSDKTNEAIPEYVDDNHKETSQYDKLFEELQ